VAVDTSKISKKMFFDKDIQMKENLIPVNSESSDKLDTNLPSEEEGTEGIAYRAEQILFKLRAMRQV